MTKEAEANEAEDRKFKELVETRNKADMLISSTEKSLKEYSDKASEQEKKDIEAAIEELKKVKDGEDKDAIEKSMEHLSQVAHKFAEEIYKEAQAKAQAGQQAGATQETKNADDDVAEAEIVD